MNDQPLLPLNIGPPPCTQCTMVELCRVQKWACDDFFQYTLGDKEFNIRKPSQSIFAKCYPKDDDNQIKVTL